MRYTQKSKGATTPGKRLRTAPVVYFQERKETMFTKEDNEVFDRIIEKRSTCRSFSERLPEKEDIEKIIDAGTKAPYASIDAKAIDVFRHFYVIFHDDPRMEVIDRLIREQSALDLERRLEEKKSDPFLQENGERVEKLWDHVAKHGESTFPNPPCMIVVAEWRGARRAERQSLAHLMENMWLKATSLNLDFQIISVIENMVSNKEFCDMFHLPVGEYGFHACVVGYAKKGAGRNARCTTEVHFE